MINKFAIIEVENFKIAMKKQKTSLNNHRRRIIFAAVAILIAVVVLWVYTNSSNWRNETARQEDIPYCGTTNKQQTLDYYRPEHAGNEALPIVAYIHGGGWRWGTKRNAMINNYGALFIKHRIAVASISYRLSSASPYPDQPNDIACALTYLTQHASDLHIDTTRLILMGESAGGELAAFSALRGPTPNYVFAPPVGVIDFYGVSDFTRIINSAHPDLNARRFLGANYAHRAVEASPITYVSAHAPRFLLLHGENDKIVPAEQSQLLYDKLVSVGAKPTYIRLQSAAHGFVGPELQPSTYKVVLDSINAFLQTTIEK